VSIFFRSEAHGSAVTSRSEMSSSENAKKSFASFFGVDTDPGTDPEFLHQPRALASQNLGDSDTPELFDVLLAEAEQRALQRVEKLLCSWCPDRNLPAVIAVFRRMRSTVMKLTLSPGGLVEETVIDSFFSSSEALAVAHAAAKAGLLAIGITDKLTLNDRHLLQPEFLFEDLDIVFLLLETNPSLLNKRDESDHTVLWLAAEAGNTDMVRLCLRYNVTVDCADEVGETPLFAACRAGHFDVVQALVETGANSEHRANAKWTPGFTPLLMAACKGHAEITSFLILVGADVTVTDNLGRSAVSLAKRHEHRSIYLMLKQAVAQWRSSPPTPSPKRANGTTSPGERQLSTTSDSLAMFELSDWSLISEIDGGLKIKRVLLLPENLQPNERPPSRGPKLVKFETPKAGDVSAEEIAAATRLARWWRRLQGGGSGGSSAYELGGPLSVSGDVHSGKALGSGLRVAIRRLPFRTPADVTRLLAAVAAMRSLSTATFDIHVVRMHEAVWYPGELWLVGDYLAGGSLAAAQRVAKETGSPFRESLVAYVVAYVLKGLEHLHSLNLAHGNVQASHVLWAPDGTIKLADLLCTGAPQRDVPPDPKDDIANVGALALSLADLDAATGQALALGQRGPWSPDFHEFVAICGQAKPGDRPSARALLLHAFVPKAPNREEAAQFFGRLVDLL